MSYSFWYTNHEGKEANFGFTIGTMSVLRRMFSQWLYISGDACAPTSKMPAAAATNLLIEMELRLNPFADFNGDTMQMYYHEELPTAEYNKRRCAAIGAIWAACDKAGIDWDRKTCEESLLPFFLKLANHLDSCTFNDNDLYGQA
jgi:hypothetical protein